MKKIGNSLYIAILMLFVTFFVSLYMLLTATRVVGNNVMIIIAIVIFGITIVTLLRIVLIYNKKELKPEKAFLYIVPIFCILLNLAMPTGRGHDETVHWTRIYEISQGTLVTQIKDGEAISTLPENALKIFVEAPRGYFKYLYYLPLLDVKIDNTKTEEIENRNGALYSFIQYIPQTAGVIIGRAISQNPVILVYIARFMNIMACTIIMYFAIKFAPFGKNILLLTSVIPIVIEGFSTLSSDGITIALSCLYISYVFNIIFNNQKKCQKKDTVILTVLGGILSLCKIVYLPILFLVLLIPKEKFKNRKSQIISMTIVLMVGIILNLTWLYFANNILVNTNSHVIQQEEKVATPKIITLLNNPLKYLCKVLYTFAINADDYLLSLFGGQLEWNEDVRVEIVPYILAGICFLATITDEKLKDTIFNKYQKIVIILIILTTVGLIFTSIYVQFANIDYSYINGIQGRYFLPILPLILILISKIKINTTYKSSQITKLICISSLITQIYVISFIMAKHI